MYLKLIKNDFRKNPWSNGILLLFISLAAAIAVMVTLMLAQLFSSITSMYETANPPHFLQMHKGTLAKSDLAAFNSGYEDLEHWQVVPMLDLYGEDIIISGENGKRFSLAECGLDISFVKQNEKYDVLLDEYRKPLTIGSGEIGVPVILSDEFDIVPGDTITLCSESRTWNFTVAAYVYDGQMNSTLCSSTRFLLNEEDFDALSGRMGETEYLIEAWFADSAQAAAYQTAYEQSSLGLPKNGQAITYTMIFLLSALTDLMTAVVFLMAGVLLIVIALVCLRYAVLAQLESDMREIGTMKAMGIPKKGICGLYLHKIRILTVVGLAIGFPVGLCFLSAVTRHINRTFGSQQLRLRAVLLAGAVSVLVYGIILLFSRKILRRLGKATVTDLLVTEKGFGRRRRGKGGLRRAKWLSFNLLLGLHEVRHGYGIIFGLLLMVSFFVVVPERTAQTMEDDEFVTYMGSPVCYLLLEVEQGEELEGRKALAETLLQELAAKGQIQSIDILRRVRLQAIGDDGEFTGIHIDTGRGAGAGLQYLVGGSPETDGEIALSCLMADELNKTVGDAVDIVTDGSTRRFHVCGIYQDVTSGGRTAKAVCDFPQVEAEKYEFRLTLSGTDAGSLADDLERQLGSGYSVRSMGEFLRQTLGGVVTQVRQAGRAVLVIGICLTALIAALFLKLRIARESAALAAKKAMGIPSLAILMQELCPILIAGGLGCACGVLMAELIGDDLISALFAILGIGLKRIVFAGAPVWKTAIVPGVLLVTLIAVTVGICGGIRRMNVAEYVNE